MGDSVMSLSTTRTHAGGAPTTFTPSHFYRFFSIYVGGRIALAEDHECESDGAAIALGRKLLCEKDCPKVEVWLRKRRIGVLEGSP